MTIWTHESKQKRHSERPRKWFWRLFDPCTLAWRQKIVPRGCCAVAIGSEGAQKNVRSNDFPVFAVIWTECTYRMSLDSCFNAKHMRQLPEYLLYVVVGVSLVTSIRSLYGLKRWVFHTECVRNCLTVSCTCSVSTVLGVLRNISYDFHSSRLATRETSCKICAIHV